MSAELETQLNRLERELGASQARADERWARLAAEGQALDTRVTRLERELGLLSTAVRVLEARVAVYAGLGATAGGILVSLIEFYLRGRFP